MRRVIDEYLIGTLNFFEAVTHVMAKDCVVSDNNVLFVVGKTKLRKSLGPGNSNLRKLKERLKRNVWIVEYDPEMEAFIKSLMSNIKITSVRVNEDDVNVTVPLRERGLAIGRQGELIKRNREIIKRLYNKDLKLVTR